jgi:zinc protease
MMSLHPRAGALLAHWLAAFGCGIALLGHAQAAVFNPTATTLNNGLEVIVIENHRAPVVSHMLWYRVGAADDPPGKSGLAHYLEHLMFKGSTNVEDGALSAFVSRHGGRDNAFTGSDYTGYYQNIPASQLSAVMRMEADRMNGITVTPGPAAAELNVVRQERLQRVDTNPGAMLSEAMRSVLHVNHPYGTPIIGWPDEIGALTLEDAYAFHTRWYAPNNAVLVVAGAVTPDEVFALAQEHYGPIAARAVPERAWQKDPPLVGIRTVVLRDERVREPRYRRIYRGPLPQADRARTEALQLASQIGTGTQSNPLYRALVIDQPLATSAGFYFHSATLGPTSLTVYVTPRPGVDNESLTGAIDAALAALKTDGFAPAAVERAKSAMLASAIYARDSLQGPAQVMGAARMLGDSIEAIETWPERIGMIEPAAVTAAFVALIDADAYVEGWLLAPESAKTAAAEAAQ